MITTLLAQALTREQLIGLERRILPKFGGGTVGDLLTRGGSGDISVVALMFWIAGTLLLIYLIFGGFKLMTGRGDPKQVAGAQQTITHALIGIVIVFMAYWIVQIISTMLGLKQTVF